jgi:hypothetical protein
MPQCKRRPSQLSEALILAWADAHFRRIGKWPRVCSGAVVDAPDWTWENVNEALRRGYWNLPAGNSLALLLQEERGARNVARLPRLTRAQIVALAEDHLRRTGSWPSNESGAVLGKPGETWGALDGSLRLGLRGFSQGSSLSKLLQRTGRKRPWRAAGPLSVEQIALWVKAHYERTGKWPTYRTGSILEDGGKTWRALDKALTSGARNLPGGSTLAYVVRLYRNILVRAHWETGLTDGKNRVDTPERLLAILVARRAEEKRKRPRNRGQGVRWVKPKVIDHLVDIRESLSG